jgi:hypothetical protein
MSILGTEIARLDDQGNLILRPEPLRLQWQLDGLLSADHHRLRGTFTCTVQPLPEPNEQRMLREVFLADKPVMTSDAVVEHLASAIRSAAEQVAPRQPASQWLNPSSRQEMIDALRSAADAVAFSCGLNVLPPFRLELESPSLQQQQVEQMQRNIAQQRTAGQLEHLQRAGELLRQFQAIRDSAPQLSPARILDNVAPADRGAMLETLLLAAAHDRPPADLYACAGGALVHLAPAPDAESTPPAPQLLHLPPDLGPLRSVEPAPMDSRRRLLVGARSGIWILDPDAPQHPRAYADRQLDSPLGFSNALIWNDELWACHSEAGIVSWKIDSFAAPAWSLRPDELLQAASIDPPSHDPGTRNPGPRNLQVLDQTRLIFSIRGSLLTLDRAGKLAHLPLEPRSEIIALVPEPDHIVVVHEDGTICRRSRSTLEMTCREQRGIRLTAAAALPWLGSIRLLLSGEAVSTWCVGLDDPLVTQYNSNYRQMRMLAGSPECVAGVSSDRQRLVLWRSWDGRAPFAEIYVTGLTRHRIADITFA